jgi:hypothetical protein
VLPAEVPDDLPLPSDQKRPVEELQPKGNHYGRPRDPPKNHSRRAAVTTCTSARSRASSVSIPISSGVPIYLLSQWHANRRADALHDISSRRNLQVTTLAYSENGTLPSLGVTEGQYGPALTLLANYMAGSFVTAAMAAHRSRKGKPGSRCWHIRERDNVGDRPMTSLSAVQRSVRS